MERIFRKHGGGGGGGGRGERAKGKEMKGPRGEDFQEGRMGGGCAANLHVVDHELSSKLTSSLRLLHLLVQLRLQVCWNKDIQFLIRLSPIKYC